MLNHNPQETNHKEEILLERNGGSSSVASPIQESVRTSPFIGGGNAPSPEEIRTSSAGRSRTSPSQLTEGCTTCGTASVSTSYVYALGKIQARFPTLSLEKEFAQATGREQTVGKTDRQAFYSVASKRENRYLARQICWVLTIHGMDTYLLKPRDPSDFDLLLEAVHPDSSSESIDVVIGLKGDITPPEVCNGLMVPTVAFDQIYSFDRKSLINAIPSPGKISAEKFRPAAGDLFDRIMRLSDNAGSTDEHRALNYLTMRYPAIYATAAECHGRQCSLVDVETRPSRLNGTRKVLDVIFSYTHRQTDVTEKFFVRVDVSEEFPFLVTKMSPYYDIR